MSSQKKSSRLEGKDLITIGIYTVIYVVIVKMCIRDRPVYVMMRKDYLCLILM